MKELVFILIALISVAIMIVVAFFAATIMLALIETIKESTKKLVGWIKLKI